MDFRRKTDKGDRIEAMSERNMDDGHADGDKHTQEAFSEIYTVLTNQGPPIQRAYLNGVEYSLRRLDGAGLYELTDKAGRVLRDPKSGKFILISQHE